MPRSSSKRQQALLRVAKATREQHDQWNLGAHIREQLQVDLDQARHQAVVDRLALASLFLTGARAAFASERYRDATSRAYYAAYHALRAATFKATGGDDHEKHSDLPNHLPEDLPDPPGSKNGLTTARLARNGADYDPYPKSDSAWKADAEETLAFAQAAIRDARRYVRDGR
ncbi:MAG: HEPN domain-containing protein [Solirubrobacteraceae bacterium]